MVFGQKTNKHVYIASEKQNQARATGQLKQCPLKQGISGDSLAPKREEKNPSTK